MTPAEPATGEVPQEIIALMPRYIEDPDIEYEDRDCYVAHSVTWGPGPKGVCGDCPAEFTPDDIRLREDVREQVEAASVAAGLVRACPGPA